jgi:hypothetical protein
MAFRYDSLGLPAILQGADQAKTNPLFLWISMMITFREVDISLRFTGFPVNACFLGAIVRL